MLMPEFNVLADVTKCVSEQRAAEKGFSFGHLVGAGEQAFRHGQSERFGGLEVDSQFELRWLLNGKISRLVSIENTGSVNADLAILALTESGLLPAEQ